MPETITTSKEKKLTPKTTSSVPENPQDEIPYMDWETLIDISEEASSSSLREFIINHIGFKAYITYKLKQNKAIWAIDTDMLTSSLEELENLKELTYKQTRRLLFLTDLLDEAQSEQYRQWLEFNQNNINKC